MNAVIAARGLGKRYGRKFALTDCTLDIPSGHVVGLVGPNGAGKSTLLNLAVGLLSPSAGSIEVLGGTPAESPAQLGRVGFVAQDTSTYPGLSVAEHLELGRRLNPGWDRELANYRVAQLGLDVGQRAGRLSGGQRAQLALTLAIAKRPELLILDEPVASLDPLARREFLQILMETVAEHGVSVVLSSHLVADLERVCDYLVVLVASRVQLAGPVEELLASHHRLIGKPRDPGTLPASQEIIECSHTDRQSTFLVRTDDPVYDPAWTVEQIGLEDLVLAYMGQAAAALASVVLLSNSTDDLAHLAPKFRASGTLVFGALVIFAVVLAATGPNLVHSYDAHSATCKLNGVSPSNCGSPDITADAALLVVLTSLILVGPALIGIFWGAPLIARELETGTYRLGWTQSVTRRRWLAVRLGGVGLGSVVAAGLLTLMVDWWSSPIERVNADRFAPAAFGLLGITPIGYAAFAFALGVTVGVLLRRTVPAMATTLAAFVAVRLGVTYWVRPHLLAPVHADVALGPGTFNVAITPTGVSLMAQTPHIPNAWVYATALVDQAGHGPTSQFLADACPQLAAAAPRAVSGPHRGGEITRAPVGNAAFQECATKVAAKFHDVVTYQPASRYWPLQGLETAVFVFLAFAGRYLFLVDAPPDYMTSSEVTQ